jgi:tetratricopeptide (TPR) repeat protein
MTDKAPADGDGPFTLWLAACDEALAAGSEPSVLYRTAPEVTQRERLERDVAWCQRVRQLWPHLPPGSTPLANVEPTELTQPEAPAPTTIGRFHIRRELGRGAFGVVFLAYDPHLGRDVALKLPRAEVLLTPELRVRFEHEARAAAGLDHPNLVPVYEASQEGEVCYIASAYCPGITLQTWLKERTEPVSSRQAAQLIAILADAVEHAHQRGVMHRDLKPSNVLLTELPAATDDFGVPRITDFGLAKSLMEDGAGEATGSSAILGTPNYMAPEQAQGRSRTVGPAADVYALGTILYELLTGRPPLVGETALVTLQLVVNQEPLAPTRLRPGLARDLETICLQCLHKDPKRRYGSARALAADLRHFLVGEPIAARPVSAWERVVKWARRRPAAAALIVVSILAVLVVAVVVGVYTAELREQTNLAETKRTEAESQRRRAVAHLRSAREAVDRMLSRVGHDLLAPAPYTLRVREQLLEDALQHYQELGRAEESDAEIRHEVGRAWRRLGQIQAGKGQRQAEESYRHAIALYERLTTEAPDNPEHRLELAGSCSDLASVVESKQKEQLLRRALELQDELVTAYPADEYYQQEASVTRSNLANLLMHLERSDEALDLSQQAIGVFDKLVKADPTAREARSHLANSLNSRGAFLAQMGRFAEAEPLFRRSIEVFEPLVTKERAYPGDRSRQAYSYLNLSILLAAHGAAAESENYLRRAVQLRRALASEYPEVPIYHEQFHPLLMYLVNRALARGASAEAAELWEEILVQRQFLYKAAPSELEARRNLGLGYWNLANARLRLGQYRQAERSAAEVPALLPERGEGFLHAARLFCRCAGLAEKDDSLSGEQRSALVNDYGRRAVAYLQQALRQTLEKDLPNFGASTVGLLGTPMARGPFPVATAMFLGKTLAKLEQYRSDPALIALRQREDFQMLLQVTDYMP